MATLERALARGNRKARAALTAVAADIRGARLTLGLSQRELARRVGMSASRLCRIEQGLVTSLTILEASRLCAVLGLDLRLSLFRWNNGVNDAGQASWLSGFLRHVRSPLSSRLEVPLPQAASHTDFRSWDACIYGSHQVTRVEFEMRIRDAQETSRRHMLKLRDDPGDGFLLVIADTNHNRRVLRDHGDYFSHLAKLRPSAVISALQAGQHPPSGLVVVRKTSLAVRAS